MNQGPEQLERLITERLDGTLTAEERAWLDQALAADPDAARLARQYERLHDLLSGWRALRHDIDWEALAGTIGRRVAADIEREKDAAVDNLVRESVAPMPDVDWDGFKARVSSAVRRDAEARAGRAHVDQVGEVAAEVRVARRRWRRAATWIATVGAPLAAAAAIAIAVWWPGAAGEIANPHVMPAAPRVFVELDMPQAAGRVAISYDQAPPAGYTEQTPSLDESPADQPSSGGGMVIAVESSAAQSADWVDEVAFY